MVSLGEIRKNFPSYPEDSIFARIFRKEYSCVVGSFILNVLQFLQHPFEFQLANLDYTFFQDI